MNEIVNFTEKLSDCDLVVLTPINEGRFYCRFYAKGLYLDRMFVTDLNLQEELILLSKNDEIIDQNSVALLKEKYRQVPEATDGADTLKNSDTI